MSNANSNDEVASRLEVLKLLKKLPDDPPLDPWGLPKIGSKISRSYSSHRFTVEVCLSENMTMWLTEKWKAMKTDQVFDVANRMADHIHNDILESFLNAAFLKETDRKIFVDIDGYDNLPQPKEK